MRSLSAPIMVKQPTHSPSIRGSVYASPPRLHDAPLMDSTLGPTLASPFSSLQAPQKGSLHISPDCFCSSSLKPSYQPDLSCWPHPSDNRFLRKEKRGPPAPSQGDPRSQLPVSGASPNLQITCTASPSGPPSHGTNVKVTNVCLLFVFSAVKISI